MDIFGIYEIVVWWVNDIIFLYCVIVLNGIFGGYIIDYFVGDLYNVCDELSMQYLIYYLSVLRHLPIMW